MTRTKHPTLRAQIEDRMETVRINIEQLAIFRDEALTPHTYAAACQNHARAVGDFDDLCEQLQLLGSPRPQLNRRFQ